MGTATNQYQPDYAVPPGWIIVERLAAQGISRAESARRCGRSPKLISEIKGRRWSHIIKLECRVRLR